MEVGKIYNEQEDLIERVYMKGARDFMLCLKNPDVTRLLVKADNFAAVYMILSNEFEKF